MEVQDRGRMMKTEKAEPSREAKLEVIRLAVRRLRKKMKITKLPGPLPELSCEMHGEYHNLFWRSLLYTDENEKYGCYDLDDEGKIKFFDAGWGELKDPEVLDGVYREAVSNLK